MENEEENKTEESIPIEKINIIKNTRTELDHLDLSELMADIKAVSYTHLTLPTNREV